MKPFLGVLTLLGVCLTPASAFAVFAHIPLPSPPKADEVGEVAFERSDYSENNSEHVRMERDEFLRFFQKGIFHNDGNGDNALKLVYKTDRFPKPLNKKGGWQYCGGAFATKSGAVFFWHRPRIGVIEITDHQYRTGWLILPEYLKPESTKKATPADASKPRR
jgi:hypothetical protein